MPRINLKKLAEACGLAQTTVSNILSGHPGAYAEETRKKVLSLAGQLGYYPSRLPRFLRDNQSSTVALLVTNLTDPYFAELLDMFTRVLKTLDMEVMVGVPHWSSREEAQKAYHSFLSWCPRAFLITADDPNVLAPEDLDRATRSTAFITLTGNPWSGCSAVYPNRRKIARLATEHLVSLGHRRIGMLIGEGDDPRKVQNFREALRNGGLELLEQDIWPIHVHSMTEKEVDDQREDTAFNVGSRLAGHRDIPTALVATCDMIAVPFMSGFVFAGGKIPDDLSVVTYNNTRYAETASLPLTAVGLPIGPFTETTVRLVQDILDAQEQGQTLVRQIEMDPDLVARRSSGPAHVFSS